MLNQEHYEVIKEICRIEIDNLMGIREVAEEMGFTSDEFNEYFSLVGFEFENNFMKQLCKIEDNFTRVLENPQDLLTLSTAEISIFRHILFNYSEAFNEIIVADLWRMLFLTESLFTVDKLDSNFIY